MFKCKVCPEKDQRVKDLKEEIRHLRSQLNFASTANYTNIEANSILSGSQQVIDVTVEPTPDEIRALKEANDEANSILFGTY